ncbi:hypothetical protein ACFXPA_23035 [Amycolatopsis sp. NPDC059090]|uniref:hypothetical protein n=1 Tax=unclassified Amycolatopsis TaxID=2618356 RepID=UPI00366B3467
MVSWNEAADSHESVVSDVSVLTRLAPQVQATATRVSEGGTRHCVTTSGDLSPH